MRWTTRWCALHGKTIYWFSGYYKLKGSMELTRGTRLRVELPAKGGET